MSKKEDRSEFIEYPVDDRWRFSIRDEPDDILLRIDFFNAPQKPGKWQDIAKIDQTPSQHDEYHVHLPGESKRIPIGKNLTREQKIIKGFETLRHYANAGRIYFGSHIFTPSEQWDTIQQQILNREIPLGSVRNTKSLSLDAIIIDDSLDITLVKSNGDIEKRNT